MSKTKLYSLSAILLLAGYVYLIYNIAYSPSVANGGPTVCFIKNVTGIPCPSCGSTRAILSLTKGDFTGALYWNPLGIVLLLIMAVLPLWLLYDVAGGKSSFLLFYQRFEVFVRRKNVAYAAIVLLAVNWIWNINKGL